MQKEDSTIPFHRRPIYPDRELLLWEQWIEIRKDETTGLGRKLERPPVDLAMNLLAKVREEKERKIALEHAQIEKKTGVRGSLWDRPERLKQPCYCAPAYELQRTQAEKGRPRIVEHIDVPVYIREAELGMSGEPLRQPCPQLDGDYETYKNLREAELVQKLKKIDPFRPDMKELMVRGRNPPPPPPVIPPLPKIVIDEPDSLPEKPLSGVYILNINNTIFYKKKPRLRLDHVPAFRENADENCKSWIYYFNVYKKRAGQSKLFLQNLGTVTLRYCWKKIKQSINFIPDDEYEQAFFFNTNEDVISPGVSKEIFFTFIANQPGIYNETWELSMSNVDFFEKSGQKIIIKLYGDSVRNIETIVKKIEVLKRKVDENVVINLVTDIFEEVFDKVFEIVPQIYPYKKYFLEAEIFVMKNPVCFYHQTEVNKMSGLYTEMGKGDPWDLSIGTWREKMMAKEFEDRMKYYALLRQSHAEFLKPWYEGDGLIKEKIRTVNYLLGQFANKFDKEYAYVTDLFVEPRPVNKPTPTKSKGTAVAHQSRSYVFERSSTTMGPDALTKQLICNLFYMRMYEHLGNTIELCAGVLSSLDLNKWIQFDFCRGTTK